MTQENDSPQVIWVPWIPVTTGAAVNGVKYWDHRWWMNIICKINWFFHFKLRKRFKKLSNTPVNRNFYTIMNYEGMQIQNDTHDSRDNDTSTAKA